MDVYGESKSALTEQCLRYIILQGFNTSGLYYKHMPIVNYASSVINKIEALLTDDAWVVIYDRHVFIVHATADGQKLLCFNELYIILL